MYAEERQQAMAQLVAEHGRLSVNVLAEQYDVKEAISRKGRGRQRKVRADKANVEHLDREILA